MGQAASMERERNSSPLRTMAFICFSTLCFYMRHTVFLVPIKVQTNCSINLQHFAPYFVQS